MAIEAVYGTTDFSESHIDYNIILTIQMLTSTIFGRATSENFLLLESDDISYLYYTYERKNKNELRTCTVRTFIGINANPRPMCIEGKMSQIKLKMDIISYKCGKWSMPIALERRRSTT